jgi:tRNA(fMet)-specific endonuclease VapC
VNPLYMLDTNICIYIAKRNPPELLARFDRISAGQVVMSIITYGELAYGANRSVQRAKSLANLEEMILDIPVEPLTPAVGLAYGEARASLANEGRLIGANDLWIGAHALALGVTLATNNERGFRRIPGLNVENWIRG